FCIPDGVSFTALRVSTLVASLGCLFGVYTMARDLHQPRWLCLLITMTVAVSPAYFALSYSFMTDVPFTTWAVWSAVFFSRGLRSGSGLYIILGSILALVATLSRQIGVALPFAFGVVVFLKSGVGLRTVRVAISPVIFCVGGLLVFHHLLAINGLLPTTYNQFSTMAWSTITHPRALSTVPFINIFSIVFYLGLFLLPILLCENT